MIRRLESTLTIGESENNGREAEVGIRGIYKGCGCTSGD